MQTFSIWSLLRNALSYHEGWQKQWRSPVPQRSPSARTIPRSRPMARGSR